VVFSAQRVVAYKIHNLVLSLVICLLPFIGMGCVAAFMLEGLLKFNYFTKVCKFGQTRVVKQVGTPKVGFLSQDNLYVKETYLIERRYGICTIILRSNYQ